MDRRKILIVNTVPMALNGISAVILNYLSCMNRNFQIDLLTNNVVDSSLQAKLEDYKVRMILISGRNRNLMKYSYSLMNLIRREKYQVIHVHGNSCTMAVELFIAKLCGVKVRCAHSHNSYCLHQKVHKLLRPLFDLSYNRAIACGCEAGKWLFQDKHFVVLKNATDVNKYRFNPTSRRNIRLKYNLNGKFAIGHVANFIEVKNHLFLLEVFRSVLKEMPDTLLFLIGDGGLKNTVQEKAEEYGIIDKIIFTGIIRNVPEMLSAMDMMVLPSLYEGLPNVVIEWQVAGLPSLISTNVTKDCKMTDYVTFAELDKKYWIDSILHTCSLSEKEREEQSNIGIAQITQAGYNILEAVKELEDIYMS